MEEALRRRVELEEEMLELVKKTEAAEEAMEDEAEAQRLDLLSLYKQLRQSRSGTGKSSRSNMEEELAAIRAQTLETRAAEEETRRVTADLKRRLLVSLEHLSVSVARLESINNQLRTSNHTSEEANSPKDAQPMPLLPTPPASPPNGTKRYRLFNASITFH